MPRSPVHPVSSKAEFAEYAFDGIVGPTHQYAGLSPGNLASQTHEGELGNPRAAALQGLAKMRIVAGLGAGQAVLPPHERPYLPLLRRLGYRGSDARILERVSRDAPWLLRAASSASAMWCANAATVTSSLDSADGRVHFTPANLTSMLHRSLEAETTHRIFSTIFANSRHFAVHEPLPPQMAFADEGAANHTRLVTSAGKLNLFGWGCAPDSPRVPARFPARQARAASQSVARGHRLSADDVVFWQQDPTGIDAGAFHTDVLAVGSGSLFLLHERAFDTPERLSQELRTRLGTELQILLATDEELPISDAVMAYPFNSQLVSTPNGELALIAPRESKENRFASAFLDRARAESRLPLRLIYVDVNASMKNGGGPACLRLRVWLTRLEKAHIVARVFFDEALDTELTSWVARHYRDRLTEADLRDPKLLDETRSALDELSQLLGLGAVYDFQRAP